jgi:hypothetical protein
MNPQAKSRPVDAEARPTPAAVESAVSGDALPAQRKEKAPATEEDGEPDWLLVLLRALGALTV